MPSTKEQRNAKKSAKIAAGQCLDCDNSAEPGRLLCISCRDANKASRFAKAAKRKDAGVCAKCTDPICDGSTFLCQIHLEKHRNKNAGIYNQRKDAGLCTKCGIAPAVVGFVYCEAHLQEERSRKQARRDAGLCNLCDTPHLPGAVFCETHRKDYANRKLLQRYGVVEDELLVMYQDQNGLCKCCGVTSTGLAVGKKPTDSYEGLLVCEHDHKLGSGNKEAVRGLTCNRCNQGIDILETHPFLSPLELAMCIVEYLRAFERKQSGEIEDYGDTPPLVYAEVM